MKLLALTVFSIFYMSAVAYGNPNCENKSKTSPFSQAGALTSTSQGSSGSSGTR